MPTEDGAAPAFGGVEGSFEEKKSCQISTYINFKKF